MMRRREDTQNYAPTHGLAATFGRSTGRITEAVQHHQQARESDALPDASARDRSAPEHAGNRRSRSAQSRFRSPGFPALSHRGFSHGPATDRTRSSANDHRGLENPENGIVTALNETGDFQ